MKKLNFSRIIPPTAGRDCVPTLSRPRPSRAATTIGHRRSSWSTSHRSCRTRRLCRRRTGDPSAYRSTSTSTTLASRPRTWPSQSGKSGDHNPLHFILMIPILSIPFMDRLFEICGIATGTRWRSGTAATGSPSLCRRRRRRRRPRSRSRRRLPPPRPTTPPSPLTTGRRGTGRI